ncbi:hypothetical protein D3C86_1744280 [compost metagenome]
MVAPDVQPGLGGQAWRAGQQGQLGKPVGTFTGRCREASIGDGDRLADQVGGHARRCRADQVVERATSRPVGTVQPQRQAAIGQWPVVFLAQAGCRQNIGIGQVQLHTTGTECLQLPGDLTAQAMGEGIRTDLSITPQQIDDFFHSYQTPRCG